MKLRRLLDMSPAELAFRGRQAVTALHQRVAAPHGVARPALRLNGASGVLAPGRRLRARPGDDPELARALQERCDRLGPGRFFAGAGDPGLAARLARRAPAWRDAVIARADAVCAGRFAILGYGELDFGEPVNWHCDPVSGRVAPPRHASTIDYLDPVEVGDSKVVWELNRHQWLLDLGQAYRITGEERYAEAFLERLGAWMQDNPCGFGVNWTSALEAAMRVIAWTWALALFRGAAALTAERHFELLAWIDAHGCFIERKLSRYFSPNTHLTGEALGLYYAGTVFPELERAPRWRALGRDILVEEAGRQVLPDGVYFEHSTRYQYYTVEIYLHFAILAARNGEELPGSVPDCLRRMLDFLLQLRRPDGSLPAIGDGDGGWLLPLVRRAPGDFSALFSTAAVLFDDPALAWAAGGARAETFWLLGQPESGGWNFPAPIPPATERVRHFEAGGYAVVRSGWGERDHHLVFDAGPLASDASGAHGHADLLSIQLSAFGENYLVDAGTGCYTTSKRWRDHFRGSQAHSTLRMDGQDQAQPRGPFGWRHKPAARLRACESEACYLLLDAEHDAWAGLGEPVIHRRRVLFVDGAYWLVIDDLQGAGEHRACLRYQFAPLAVASEAGGWVRARGERSALLLRAFAHQALAAEVAAGEIDPPRGWVSPDYGQRIPAPCVDYQLHGTLPLRILTWIQPLAVPGGSPPEGRAIVEQGRVTGLTVGGERPRTIRFDGEAVSVTDAPTANSRTGRQATCVA